MKFILFLFIFLISFFNVFAATEVDRQEQVVQNFYGNNPGFESGIKDITVSSSTKSWEGTTKHLGNKALKCTFDATNDYCETKLVPHKGETSNMEWGFFYYVTVSTVKAEIIDNSGNVVRTFTNPDGSTRPLLLNTDYQEAILDYTGVKGASYKLRLTATSGAATFYLDTMHVSKNMNIGTVAQANFFGQITWPATTNCIWSKTNSSTLGSFSADSDCTTPAGSNLVGNVAAPGTKIPAINLVNGPKGRYVFIATGVYRIKNTSATASENEGSLRFYDSNLAVYSANSKSFFQTQNSSGTVNQETGAWSQIVGEFTFEAFSSKMVEIHGATRNTATSTIEIAAHNDLTDYDSGSPLTIAVYYYPSATETVVKSDNSSQSWAGFHGGDCSWTRNAASFADSTADATCTFTERVNNNFGTVASATSGSDKLPGIVLTPNRTGTIEVCALMGRRHTTSGEGYVRLTDGTTIYYGAVENATTYTQTTLCGQYNVSTGVSSTIKLQLYADTNATEISGSGSAANSASVSWSVKWVYPTQAMSQIVNNVSTNYTGRFIKDEATLNCDASSAITSQAGSWVASIGNISSGACTVTLTNGKFNSTPRCRCFDQSATLDSTTKANATSTTSVSIIGTKPSDGTALTSFDCALECSESR